MRLMPDGPFPEVGHPYLTDVSADGRWIAVSCPAGGRGERGRIVVYRADDLSLWDQIVLGQGVEEIAFHPVLPVLAVGTEDGDEWERRGGLHLYEPEARRCTDVSVAGAGVTALCWRDARRLEVTFARPDADSPDLGEETYTGGGGGPPGVRQGAGHRSSAAALRDGRILAAARSETLLECWSPDGTLLWSVPVPEPERQRSGCQMYIPPDEETVRITVLRGDSSDRCTLLCRYALADGAQLAELRLDFPVAISARTDGAWLARDSRDLFPSPRWPPYESVVLTPSGRQLATLALGESDRSFDFPVRRSPHLLFLRRLGIDDTGTELDGTHLVRRAYPDGGGW